MEKIITRIVDLPTGIRGYTSLDPDGDYNVYINAKLSESMQKRVLAHEITHIKRDDFSDTKTVDEAEKF